MRKIIGITFASLDGVMQPGGPREDISGNFKCGGWIAPYVDDFSGKVMMEQMSVENSELLLGRKTCEIFAGYWPQHASGWSGINEVKKHVVSHDSSYKPDWENSVLLPGKIAKKVKKLKSEDRSNLHVWGSSNLIQTLLKHNLVDELWLKIFPVTFGLGKRLFAEGMVPTAFNLTDRKVSPLGVIIANYTRAGGIQTETF